MPRAYIDTILLVEAGEAALVLGDQLRVEGRQPVARDLQGQLAGAGQHRLGAVAVAAVGAAVRLAAVEMVVELGLSGFSCVAGHEGKEGAPPWLDGKLRTSPMSCWTSCCPARMPPAALQQGGLLDELKKALAERALNAEMDHHLGGEAGAGNSRNGYGRKTVLTDTGGRIALEVPRDRQGSFDPQLIAKYQRRFPGFDEKIVSLYARGLSTREIAGHVLELYGIEVSPDLVSAVTDAVLDEIATWQARPLEPVYPLVFFDALRVKIRDEGLVRNKAVHIALGVRADGTKEILGLWLEQNEGAKFWLRVLNELRNRGVEDILLAVVDGLKGFPEAIQAAFPETTVQTCIVHLLRHSLDFVSWKDRRAVAAALKEIYRAVDPAAGRGRADGVRGGALGPEIRRHRAELAARLDGGGAVLCLPRRCAPIALHDERHRGLERQAAQRGPHQGPFPHRRGRAEAALSRLEQDRAGVEDASTRVGSVRVGGGKFRFRLGVEAGVAIGPGGLGGVAMLHPDRGPDDRGQNAAGRTAAEERRRRFPAQPSRRAVLQMLMEADVEGLIGAGRHERTGERLNYRNGYRERTLDTRLGSLQLRIPSCARAPTSRPSWSRARPPRRRWWR